MTRCLLSLLALALTAPLAHAHFIWIVPQKDGVAEVIYSDALEPDDPPSIEPFKQTKWYVRTSEGKTEELKLVEGKNAQTLTNPGKSAALVGGVWSRPFGEILINYYATALVPGKEEDAKQSVSMSWDMIPLQLCQTEGGRVRVLFHGKPLADANVGGIPARNGKWADGSGRSIRAKTDAKGEFDPRMKAGGLFGFQVRHSEKAGTHEGKEYKKIEHHASLVVRAAPPKADAEATKLLADARAARAVWKDFPGFRADIEVNFDGKLSKGQVTVDAKGKLTFTGVDKEHQAWAERNLGSLVGHRLDSGLPPRETPCAFADDVKDHPLGREIRVLNDELHSGYRIKDNQIMVVMRQMKDRRFTITVQEQRKTPEGKYLSASFAVDYWNLETGELVRSEANVQTWTRVGAFDLPIVSRVTKASKECVKGDKPTGDEDDDSYTTKSLTLSNHKLLEAAK